jgi:anti-anti-sigma factor
MTTHHPCRPDHRSLPFADGPATTVAGWDGAVLATLTRRIHPAPAGADGSLTIIAVDGDIDQDTAPMVHAALVEALDGGLRVCCDISRVDFFGAAALNTMLAAHHHAARLHRTFSLRGVHGLAGRVLALAGLTGVIAVDD